MNSEIVEISQRLKDVSRRIRVAAEKADRDPASITLVAVSKRVTAERIAIAIESGQRVFGENYVQEARAKFGSGIGSYTVGRDLELHCIGPLQRNKVRDSVGFFSLIQTLDRVELAEAISRQALGDSCLQGVLLQVNISAETSKSGVAVDKALPLAQKIIALPGIELRGVMAIGREFEESALEQSRNEMWALGRLREDLRQSLGLPLPILSMGMSADFELAIECGASHVRVGSAIFGERQ